MRKVKYMGGPGCGKTYNLMSEYKTLLQSGYKQEDITLITFRKSSAESLKNAVSDSVQSDGEDKNKHVGTIHSICWRLCGYPEVMKASDFSNFIKQYGYSTYVKTNTTTTDVVNDDDIVYSGDLIDLYTWCMNTQTPYDRWYRYPGSGNILLPNERIYEFMHNYQNYKKEIGKIDYSDMIQGVLDNKIDLDTPILMVDEFQDLTKQMYDVFKMWESKRDCVIIAGDPYQSIYGFWGGSPDYLIEYEAEEIVIGETRRLPAQIHEFACKILKYEGMKTPELKAKDGYENPITTLNYGCSYPSHKTELHLIRCNYQAGAIAMQLANEGKIFGGECGWTPEEIKIANAIIAFRNGKALSKDNVTAIADYYPVKMFGRNLRKEDLKNYIENKYSPELPTGEGFVKRGIVDSVLSNDPTAAMTVKNKLFTQKIKSILNMKKLIMSWEPENRKILTIHGSKGLEAEAVFLHTAITPRIQKAIVIPGEESAAEARVWYVGATRAKDVLYIVKDAGKNYNLPGVGETC